MGVFCLFGGGNLIISLVCIVIKRYPLTHTPTLKLKLGFILKSGEANGVNKNKFSELSFYMLFAFLVCLVLHSLQYNM